MFETNLMIEIIKSSSCRILGMYLFCFLALRGKRCRLAVFERIIMVEVLS